MENFIFVCNLYCNLNIAKNVLLSAYQLSQINIDNYFER